MKTRAHNKSMSNTHRNGQFIDAKIFYEDLCKTEANNPSAWLCLGIAHAQLNDLDQAEKCLRTSISIQDNIFDAHYNLAKVLHLKKCIPESIQSYLKSISLNPKHYDALNGIGTALHSQGKTGKAIKYLNDAVTANPKNSKAYYNLGYLYHSLNKHDDAIRYYQQAIKYNPDHFDSINNLGAAYNAVQRHQEAKAFLMRAQRLRPHDADIYNNLGIVLHAIGEDEQAVAHFNNTIRIDPNHHIAHNNLGSVYFDMDLLDNAYECFHRAAAIKPDFHEAVFNIARVLHDKGEFDEACLTYKRSIDIFPDYTMAHWNLADVFLRKGILDHGWEEYEWGLKSHKREYRDFGFPNWDGQSPQNNNILVIPEQGVGDEIMFASCLPDLISACRHCVIICDKRLAPFYKRSFPEATIYNSERIDIASIKEKNIDAQICIGSLPKHYRQSTSRFPTCNQYLHADPALKEYWKRRLTALDDNLKVGISWRGGKANAHNNNRILELSQWLPVLSTQGATFINIQYDKRHDEADTIQQQYNIQLHDWDEIRPLEDLEQLAALISSLDLVISVDNSTVHLSGSLGIPTWVLLPKKSDWRWLLERESSLWYPSLRLFRQSNKNTWQDVIESIKDNLIELATHQS